LGEVVGRDVDVELLRGGVGGIVEIGAGGGDDKEGAGVDEGDIEELFGTVVW